MGLFTSKIFLAVAAGGTITAAGLGLTFGGTETLKSASASVQEFGNRITQYETNENSLLAKIGLVKQDASTKLAESKAQIETLTSEKATLEITVVDLKTQISTLETQIADIKAQLETEKGNNADLQKQLDAKTAELEAKNAELEKANADLVTANKKIEEQNKTIAEATVKANQADGVVAELEAEIQKANDQVQQHGQDVAKVKTDTDGSQPLTQAEIDAIDTTIK